MIVLLQASDKSYVWDSCKQGLPELLDIVKANCLNKDVRLAYQLPWGHTEQTALSELEGNIECAKKLKEEYGIEHIIPVGVAVQNARNTTLNTTLYLTRDHWHLCMGVGRYVAACTFFESVIAPVYMSLKKVGSVIKIPRRQFLGRSPKLEQAVHDIIEEALKEYFDDFEILESR